MTLTGRNDPLLHGRPPYLPAAPSLTLISIPVWDLTRLGEPRPVRAG